MVNPLKSILELKYRSWILKIKSKIKTEKKNLTKSEQEKLMEKNSNILDEIPKKCKECNSEKIEYWDETEEEIIFRCLKCKIFYTFSLNREKLSIFFKY